MFLQREVIHRTGLLLATCLVLALTSPTHASEAADRAALVEAAGLGPEARTWLAASDGGPLALGVVLAGERGRVLVLRRAASGSYEVEATSPVFPNDFGPGYYIEAAQSAGPGRFHVQVNMHSGCGIGVEVYRFARSGGVWRLSGYDRSDPDTLSCDINLRSREYSANLLSRKVSMTHYRDGKVAKRESRASRSGAPMLAEFRFGLFDKEP